MPLAVNGDLFGRFAGLMTVVISPISVLIVSIVFFYIFGSKKALKEINKGAKRKLGTWFIPLSKYVFVITTILVVILGIAYGGIG